MRSAVSSLTESTQQTRDLLERVNQEISSCPAGDIKRMGELQGIQRNLANSLRNSLGAVNDFGNFSLTQIAEGVMMEGACAFLGLALP
jgi:hypothetical protein